MSENIFIREGDVGRQFTVEKIKTNRTGGGSCLWIPEEDVRVITKTITANGKYKAVDDGAYGFSEITVNVPDVIIKILTGIKIVNMPKTQYTEGEAFNFSALKVAAVYSDGSMDIVTDKCKLNPANGDTAVLGMDTVTVTYSPNDIHSFTTQFGVTVQEKPKRIIKALQLMPTSYEESLAKIQSVLSIPNKMLQRIEAKRSSVFGGMSLNIVLSAGYCNYKGSGGLRFTLSDITPYVNGKYLLQYSDPAYGVSQGVSIPSEYASYRELFPHMYMWENCTGNNFLYLVATEGELEQDSAYSTPWKSDLCLGFGSDVFDYNPFASSGKQPYQAYAANYMIVDVEVDG